MAFSGGWDEFVGDEGYPGCDSVWADPSFVVEPISTFGPADAERFWFLDFHWPRGLTPLGLLWNVDGYSWGTQLAAERMPLPTGRGITQRMAGTHTYASAIPLADPARQRARSDRMQTYLPRFLESFPGIWAQRLTEIEAGWRTFRNVDYGSADLPELHRLLVAARHYQRRACEIHFEVMYPLLTNYLGFRGLCLDLGIEPSEVDKFLQGYDTRIMETDRALSALAADARAAGLEPVFARTPVDRLARTLATRSDAAGWWTAFAGFLDAYGYRTEGTADVALPSWVEDPRPALGMIKTFLQRPSDHDFGAAQRAAVTERDTAIDAARGRLTRPEQRVFDAGLHSVRVANFPQWQDDHNFYIDLRVALPLRWAALAIAERVGADQPDDTMFLFWAELSAVAAGHRPLSAFRSLVDARRQYFEHWRVLRPSMPKVLGRVPDRVSDPILIEIFGLNGHFLDAVGAVTWPDPVTTLRGVAAARGVASGVAHVLRESADLHLVQPGEVLVCESTSPSWTPAFAKIAACICDSGGALSHAAIVGREYGVPTVTACGTATRLIADGDEVEVDGTHGTVTIVRRAAEPPPAGAAAPTGEPAGARP